MEHLDLVERLVPEPTRTLVVETPTGDLVLIDTARPPTKGDTVFTDHVFSKYEASLAGFVTGVAYCIVKFL